jgi:hypothetical protein
MAIVQSRSFAWRRVGRFVLAVHGQVSPGDGEWDACVNEIVATPGPIHVLVHTEGGAPNAAQRVRLTAGFKGRKISVAVLTQSALARAAGIALRWFRPEVRLFAPTEVDAALDYLEATSTERIEIQRSLAEMKAAFNLSNVRTD